MSIGMIMDPAFQGEAPVPTASPPLGSGADQWPRMLTLDDDTESRLKMYLTEEIDRARVERTLMLEDWIRWQAQYWADPADGIKNWPFPRAANIVIPLTAIAVEAIYARFMTTLFGIEPFYSIRPKAAEWIEAAPEVESWLQTEIQNPDAIGMFEFLSPTLMELIKLGTCVGKTGYERIVRKSERDGSEYFYTQKNGATLDYVPLANFLIRMAEYNLEDAPWLGEEHIWTWSQMKTMSFAGRLGSEQVDEVKRFWTDRQRQQGEAKEYQDNVDLLIGAQPIWHEEFRITEVWLRFDVDGDGIDEEIVVDYHWESEIILSARYNWYDDLRRPYRLATYVPIEGRIWGIGVGKQNEQFQMEATTIHRQRLDNATLANMGMIAIKKGSGYGPKEPIFPGKMWFLDDVTQIQPFKLSEVYPSSFNDESIIVTYSEKRTGVNEVILGQPQEGTPGTATGDLARIQEGNKRFDMVLKNVRRWLSRLGTDLLSCYQQFGDMGRHWLILGDDGQFVEKMLLMPATLVRQGALIEVTATDSVTNKDVAQRQWLALSQVLQQYYVGQIQIAQALDPALAQQVMIAAMISSTEAAKRLLTTFDMLDAEKLLISPLTGGANGQPQPQQAQPAALPPAGGAGGGGGLPPTVGPEGLGAVSPLVTPPNF